MWADSKSAYKTSDVSTNYDNAGEISGNSKFAWALIEIGLHKHMYEQMDVVCVCVFVRAISIHYNFNCPALSWSWSSKTKLHYTSLWSRFKILAAKF